MTGDVLAGIRYDSKNGWNALKGFNNKFEVIPPRLAAGASGMFDFESIDGFLLSPLTLRTTFCSPCRSLFEACGICVPVQCLWADFHFPTDCLFRLELSGHQLLHGTVGSIRCRCDCEGRRRRAVEVEFHLGV